MSFQRRMHIGESHESAVARELERRGWTVVQFGQGLLPDDIRTALMDRETPLRWLPDLIAAKPQQNRVVLVDAKSEQRSDTPNHSLEVAALTSMLLHQYMYGIPVVIVWSDFKCSLPQHLKPVRWVLDTDGWVRGSRTPFLLVKKAEQVAMDDWFGEAEEAA